MTLDQITTFVKTVGELHNDNLCSIVIHSDGSGYVQDFDGFDTLGLDFDNSEELETLITKTLEENA